MAGQAAGRRNPVNWVIYAAVLALYALYLASSGWVMARMHAPGHSQVLTATQELPQSDFARFWYVGRMLFVQRAADLGIAVSLPPWFRSTFQLDVLAPGSHPELIWLYPPTMGLLAILFGLLPLALSFWTWRVATLAVASVCLSQAGLEWPAILMGLASPAEIHDIVGGQNGALTAGLLVSGLLCMDSRPRLAGVLAGCLCIKPQMAMILPLVLLHRGRLRALLACALTALLLVLLSAVVEGAHWWVWFVRVAQPQASHIMNAPFDRIVGGGFTVLMMARHFHLSVAVAWAMQIASSVVSAALIWLVWRKPGREPVSRMALTMSLSVLVTPYGFIYDLVGFSVAMAAMVPRASVRTRPVYGLLWLVGGYTLSLENMTGMIVMPFAAVFAAWVIRQEFFLKKEPQTFASPGTRLGRRVGSNW